MQQIKRLPPHVVQHIAAGEVIEKPVSIIKELLDNAIDAQATRIEIEVVQGGREKLTVTDNGCGIERKSIPLVFERYATSKIFNLDDFQKLHSLGFRGEALFSIMTAADVTIITRSYREQEGTWVRTHQGQVEEVHPTGCRVGTTIMIDRLFARFPVRKQALDAKKDFAQIKALIAKYALAYPQIGFLLKHNTAIGLSFFENEEKIDRIAKYWDIPTDKILEMNNQDDRYKWNIFLAHPELFATHRSHQLIIVNNRPIESIALDQAVDRGLLTFRHAGKFPRYVLQIEVPSELVDVNIHPQKQSLTLADENHILDSLTHHIQTELSDFAANTLKYSGESLFPSDYNSGVKEALPLFISGPFLQLQSTYILTPTQEGFLLVDQHAADERLWYNALLTNKPLLRSIEQHISTECQEELEDDIYQHSFSSQINARVATIACHQAIRAGQPLSEQEMSDIVEKVLQQGSNTVVCPHGRPTYIIISKNQLDTVFRRK